MERRCGTRRERAAWMAGELWMQKRQKGVRDLFAATIAKWVLDRLQRGKESVDLICDRNPFTAYRLDF